MSEPEPLRIEATFWERDDVTQALGNRDIGALFRLLREVANASRNRICSAVDLKQRAVSAIMNGNRKVTRIDVLERIANGLDMPDDARTRLGLAPREYFPGPGTLFDTEQFTPLTPETLDKVMRESAAEAREFTRRRAALVVDADVMEHLATVVSELDRSYQTAPPVELCAVALVYRHRVARLVDGQRTPRDAFALYAYAAHLSYLLSELSHDLNSWSAAESYAVDSLLHAEQIRHDELCAWAAEALVEALFYTGRTAESVDVALESLCWVCDQDPLAVRLRAAAARGHARQGNHAECTALLAEARTLCDQLPEEIPSLLAAATPEYTSYTLTGNAATCHVLLANWPEAERQARHTLGVATSSPGRADIARLDLGIALANLGAPDEAVEHANKALASGRWLGSLLPRARWLNTVLNNRYPDLAITQEFHEHYRQLTDRTVSN